MSGKRYYIEDKNKLKTIGYISGIILFVTAIALVFVLSLYQSKTEADAEIAAQRMNNIETEVIESTTSSTDRGINEVESENVIDVESVENDVDDVEEVVDEDDTEEKIEENENKDDEKEENEELSFIVPLEGEIIRDYSDTNLVYSETLEEWTTHYGVDIKADKGSAVSASEDGTVKSIKDDPRYGLTVTIEHEDGFKTVYSNLLSAEFITQGDTVEKGQTIGTVGSSAAFEIVDDPHLHFEMILNDSNVNPTTYWK